jgi:chromosome segregation ATPase
MRNQLKAREAAGADAAAAKSMKDDEARCELLVARLKQLRGASSAAQQAMEKCRQQLARRSSLVERLQQALEGEWKAWQRKLGPIATEVRDGGSGVPEGADAARGAEQDLRKCAEQVLEDCAQLQSHEQSLAAELAALQEPLRAAA